MESSGDEEEECGSGESGWTMYIGSPMEQDSDISSGGSNHEEEKEEEEEKDEEEEEEEEEQRDCQRVGDHPGADSDDSMASDASSRLSRPVFPSKCEENQGKAKTRKNSRMRKK